MVLLRDGLEITESFGTNGIADIKRALYHYSIKLEYLQDDYILNTYLKGCITSTDLQFIQDLNSLFSFLNGIDREAKTIKERHNNKEIHKPEKLESDMKKLEEAKTIMEKYSEINNLKVKECIKTLKMSIFELNSIRVELKSYIFKHKEVRPLTISSHLKWYGNKLLSKRIDYFKPKPDVINQLINNNLIYIKNSIENINITKLEHLINYLKDYYKIA